MPLFQGLARQLRTLAIAIGARADRTRLASSAERK